jgi:hypothetical protein
MKPSGNEDFNGEKFVGFNFEFKITRRKSFVLNVVLAYDLNNGSKKFTH